MRDVPMIDPPHRIVTSRLVLDAVRPEDASEQADAITRSLPELARWMSWAQQPQTVGDASLELTRVAAAAEAGTEWNWVIRRREDRVFVGRIGVFAVDASVPKAEIGYWLVTAHSGHGYMSEAVTALADVFAEAGIRRLEIRCDSENRRSARVAELSGFTLDAVLVNDRVSADGSTLGETLLWSKTW